MWPNDQAILTLFLKAPQQHHKILTTCNPQMNSNQTILQ